MRSHESGIEYDNMVNLLEDFCESHIDDTHIDDGNDETFRIDFYERDENVIEGELSKGDSGVKANHYNTDTNEREHDARQENISEEIPFYFLFRLLPEQSDRLLLILREYKGRGAKLAITKQLKSAIRDVTKKGIYEDKTVITEDARTAINQADRVASLKLEGEKQLRAIDDVADNEDVESHPSQTAQERIHISPENPDTSWYDPLFDTSMTYAGYNVEEYDDAKLTVKQDGSDLTFSIFDPKVDMRLVLSEDDIDLQGDHPTPESASTMARTFVNNISDEYNDGPIDPEPLISLVHRPSSSDEGPQDDTSEDTIQQTALGANGGSDQNSDRGD